MNKPDLIARIDNVLAHGRATVESAGEPIAPPPYSGYNYDHTWVAQHLAAGFRTAGLALLNSLYGENAQPFKDFDTSDR